MKSKFEGLRAGRNLGADAPTGKKAAAPTPAEPRAVGRPKGRSGTSPDAQPVTLRISRDVYKRAQKAVIDADDGQPLSRIVEDLLPD